MSAQRKPKPSIPSAKTINLSRGRSANESQFADLNYIPKRSPFGDIGELGDIADYETKPSGKTVAAFTADVVVVLVAIALAGGFGYGIGLTLVTIMPAQIAMFRNNPVTTVLFACGVSALSVACCWLRGRSIRMGGK